MGIAGLEDRAVRRLREYEDRLEMTRAADVVMTEIDWLWPGWLARGKLHVLAGDGGAGKTTLALSIAATISRGAVWPDGMKAVEGNVLIWSGEDDASDTLVPRLVAAGADLDKVFFVGDVRQGGSTRPFDPSADLEMLTTEAQRIGSVALLVVDPVVSAIVGDGHKNTEVRRSLQPLVDLGRDLRCAVLGISHFSKGGGGADPLLRVIGSVAFGASARVVLVAGKKPGSDDRVLARAKSNIGPDDGGFSYRVDLSEAPPKASFVSWGEMLDGAARDLLATEQAGSSDGSIESARDWLQTSLANGPVAVLELKAQSQGRGLSWRTIERAKQVLGIRSKKDAADGGWRWSLPVTAEARQHRQSESGGLGGVDQEGRPVDAPRLASAP